MDLKKRVTKLVSRAMEDVRGLDSKYPNEEDAKELSSALNSILDHTTNEVLIATGHECWKYSGKACVYKCEGICKNSG